MRAGAAFNFNSLQCPLLALSGHAEMRNQCRYGGKADMTVCGSPPSRSVFGVRRTWRFAPHMSAFDPKRTLGLISVWPNYAAFLPRLRLQSARLWASRGPSRRAHAAARVHYTF